MSVFLVAALSSCWCFLRVCRLVVSSWCFGSVWVSLSWIANAPALRCPQYQYCASLRVFAARILSRPQIPSFLVPDAVRIIYPCYRAMEANTYTYYSRAKRIYLQPRPCLQLTVSSVAGRTRMSFLVPSCTCRRGISSGEE